jgi:hypothetical protein
MQPPAFLGHHQEWSTVHLTVDGSGKATAIDSTGKPLRPNDIVSVGGGTWSYGTAFDGIFKAISAMNS